MIARWALLIKGDRRFGRIYPAAIRWALLGLALLALFLFATTPVSAAPLLDDDDDGEEIFQTKCSGCHTIGGGRLVGPDLQGVTELRDSDWLEDFIQNPEQLFAAGDPIALKLLEEYNNLKMPNLGLSEDEVEDVIEYLEDLEGGGAAPVQPAPTTAAPVAASAQTGRDLFTGEQPLANGGMPCIACHSVSGAGELGGGGLGPDLTQAFRRLGGEAGLSASLSNIAFPTMAGPYANHSLTPEEVASLVAFLRQADGLQAATVSVPPGAVTGSTLMFFGIAALGTLALYGLLWLLNIRRQRTHPGRLPARTPINRSTARSER